MIVGITGTVASWLAADQGDLAEPRAASAGKRCLFVNLEGLIVSRHFLAKRVGWLVAGLFCGLCISYFWPHEPSWADATDRNEKFALTTVRMDGDTEAVFVLDFLTGRLQGTVFSTQGNMFVASYFRNLAEDFKVNPDVPAQYAIVSGLGSVQSRGQNQYAAAAIYVAELSSGMVAMYSLPYQQWNRPVPQPIPLVPVAQFPFRERLKTKSRGWAAVVAWDSVPSGSGRSPKLRLAQNGIKVREN
jgi:hypothetical protein